MATTQSLPSWLVTSMRPSGRAATAVGLPSPAATTVSVKPGGKLAASAGWGSFHEEHRRGNRGDESGTKVSHETFPLLRVTTAEI